MPLASGRASGKGASPWRPAFRQQLSPAGKVYRAIGVLCLAGIVLVVVRAVVTAGGLPVRGDTSYWTEHENSLLRSRDGHEPAAAKHHVYSVPWGEHLEALPGATVLLGLKERRSSVSMRLVSALLQNVPKSAEDPEESETVALGAMLFAEDGPSSAGALPFGPTLRVRRGGTLRVRLTNALPSAGTGQGLLAAIARTVQALTSRLWTSKQNVFTGTRHTNLHMHGLHASPGLLAQPDGPKMLSPDNYTGGDNIFISIAEGETVNYEHYVPDDHYPGIHWAHPHRHGSSSLQSAHASAVVIIEDDPVWLPNRQGCKAVRTLLETAQERVFHLSLAHLAHPTSLGRLGEGDVIELGHQVVESEKPGADEAEVFNAHFDLVGYLDQANEQFLNLLSDPPFVEFAGAAGATVGTSSEGLADVLLLNGGFQPVVSMKPGLWERWRLLNTSFKRLVNLHILKLDGWPAPCEIQLLAKDGIYLPAIPRHLHSGSIFLASGGRAEVLVKCDGKAGDEYDLSAGLVDPTNPGGVVDLDGALKPMRQRTVARLSMLPADQRAVRRQPKLVSEACTPLRPSYLSDLRDESLAKAGALDKIVHRPMAMREDPTMPGCNFNDRLFAFPEPHPIVFPIGKVVEINATFTRTHALHTHISPFQIAHLPEESLVPSQIFSEYFREGDWHDVLSLPMTQTESYILLRTAPGPFGGYAVVHCHMLQHEDEGCMLLLKLECPNNHGVNAQPRKCPGFVPPVLGFKPR